MNIFLVRHGESEGNLDQNVYRTKADHAIQLSERGYRQAVNAGHFLRDYLQQGIVAPAKRLAWRRPQTLLAMLQGKSIVPKIRLWSGPYARTRRTADGIYEACQDIIFDRKEEISLSEQQFGLFDGIPDAELQVLFPREYAHYDKNERHEGKFWAGMPLGESRFQVAMRVKQIFGTFHRDAEKKGINTIVVVCHGVSLRAFVMQWLHLPYEWFEKEPNPKNCAIRYIRGHEDVGYIYPGE